MRMTLSTATERRTRVPASVPSTVIASSIWSMDVASHRSYAAMSMRKSGPFRYGALRCLAPVFFRKLRQSSMNCSPSAGVPGFGGLLPYTEQSSILPCGFSQSAHARQSQNGQSPCRFFPLSVHAPRAAMEPLGPPVGGPPRCRCSAASPRCAGVYDSERAGRVARKSLFISVTHSRRVADGMVDLPRAMSIFSLCPHCFICSTSSDMSVVRAVMNCDGGDARLDATFS